MSKSKPSGASANRGELSKTVVARAVRSETDNEKLDLGVKGETEFGDEWAGPFHLSQNQSAMPRSRPEATVTLHERVPPCLLRELQRSFQSLRKMRTGEWPTCMLTSRGRRTFPLCPTCGECSQPTLTTSTWFGRVSRR